MMVLTATYVVEERGPQTYGATPLTQILLDPGWADGLRHLYSPTFSLATTANRASASIIAAHR